MTGGMGQGEVRQVGKRGWGRWEGRVWGERVGKVGRVW